MTQRQTAAQRLAAVRAAQDAARKQKEQPKAVDRPTGLYINGVPVPRSVQAEGTAAVIKWAREHAPSRTKAESEATEAPAEEVAEEAAPARGRRARNA